MKKVTILSSGGTNVSLYVFFSLLLVVPDPITFMWKRILCFDISSLPANTVFMFISELFSFSQNYNLRSFDNFDMVIPKHNREFFKNTFQYSGANIWNSLPVNLRTSSSLAAFKNALYRVIVSNR